MGELETSPEVRLEVFREQIKKIVQKSGGKDLNAASIVDFGQLNSKHQDLWDTYGRLLEATLQERPDYSVIESAGRQIAQEVKELASVHMNVGEQSAGAFCALLKNRLAVIINNISSVSDPQYKDEIKAEWQQEFNFYFGP
ncbi:MAG: hypothetical protein HY983_02055 [Candidatus Magasanikbacteria bacterium]|nr:hypothetical protein [Candidatus Magasanikbacteria bacterium]